MSEKPHANAAEKADVEREAARATQPAYEYQRPFMGSGAQPYQDPMERARIREGGSVGLINLTWPKAK